jgi:hypothetical protein
MFNAWITIENATDSAYKKLGRFSLQDYYYLDGFRISQKIVKSLKRNFDMDIKPTRKPNFAKKRYYEIDGLSIPISVSSEPNGKIQIHIKSESEEELNKYQRLIINDLKKNHKIDHVFCKCEWKSERMIKYQ